MEKENKGRPNYDPGWNDPPMFSYESQIAQMKSSKPRIFLNKRVAFPLNEGSPPTSNRVTVDPTAPLPPCNISSLPPPPTSIPLQIKEAAGVNRDDDDLDTDYNEENTLQNVMSNLNKVLITKFEREEKDTIDIQRRLDIMEKMWNENNLCKDIQLRLLELSKALLKNEIQTADDLQKGLMVDHAPDCSPWMSGIRHLIHHKLQLADNTVKNE